MVSFDKDLVREAKAIVALAFRNGPIEDIYSGVPCPMCSGDGSFSRITDAEMKTIMKSAVSKVFRLLWQRDNDREAYQRQISNGAVYTSRWDDPDLAAV
jgi:hypothetical protein